MKLNKAILLLIISFALLSGCKKDENPTSSVGDELVGTWVLTKIILTSLGNTELSPQQVGYSATIIMKSDRTFTANYVNSSGPSSDAGTWSVANGRLTLKSNTGGVQEMPYGLVGNKLTTDTTMDVPPLGVIPTRLEFTKQ
jgi:hypothetical protein